MLSCDNIQYGDVRVYELVLKTSDPVRTKAIWKLFLSSAIVQYFCSLITMEDIIKGLRGSLAIILGSNPHLPKDKSEVILRLFFY